MKKGRTALLGAVTFAVALTGTTGALGASSFTPQLGPPNHRTVHTGRVTLKVKAVASKSVFVQIEPRKRMSHGFLKTCTNSAAGCDFVQLKRWRHHPGWWIYHSPVYTFHGWWTTTPGKYYWQARSFAKVPPCSFSTSSCIFVSSVGSFHVG